MSKPAILKCDCVSEFQDKTYGKNMRLHNTSEDGKKAYCTVCCTRSSDKQTKDIIASENKHLGVKFDTRAPKPRKAKAI